MIIATIDGVEHVALPLTEYKDIRALVDAAKNFVSVLDDMAEDENKPMAFISTNNWLSHVLITQAYAELRATTIESWMRDQEEYI